MTTRMATEALVRVCGGRVGGRVDGRGGGGGRGLTATGDNMPGAYVCLTCV